jgi:hypothetical protein
MNRIDDIPQEIAEAARKVTQFFAEKNMHNWVIDGCVSRSADDPAILDHIPAVKALREDNAKAWGLARSTSQLSIDERKLQARINELESQLAELRQGVEAVGEVVRDKEWHEDCWYYNGKHVLKPLIGLLSLPEGTKLYTRPQPAIPPGCAVVPDEMKGHQMCDTQHTISRLQSFLDRVINNSESGVHHPELYESDGDILREAITKLRHYDRSAMLASATAIQPQAASTPVAEKDAKDSPRLDFITTFGLPWSVQWEKRGANPVRFRMLYDGEPWGKWHPTARAAIDAATLATPADGKEGSDGH